MGPIGSPETSVSNHLTSHNNPEEGKIQFSGVFAKFLKATISLVMSVRLSVLCLSIFRKSIENIEVSLKCEKNNGYLTLRHLYIYDSVSLNSF